eukprot:TRINITY_DN4688_c0_g5_i1.p1 TRINITY_DN4688_c0_g5~~TRINITY_DN4688_c0_g5_i1.p1  ORF type:complete len:549 (-),score=187.91 TRINITY_DN4688_c0_g5_i1:401-2017(-)
MATSQDKPVSDVGQERVVYAIFEYLRQQSSALDADGKESLEVAIQCLSSAFSFPVENLTDKPELSISPLTLTSALSLALKRSEESNTANAQQSQKEQQEKGEASPMDVVQPKSLLEEMDELTQKRFDAYIDILSKKKYFGTLAESSDDYQQRLLKAQQRFLSESKKKAEAHKAEGNKFLSLGDNEKAVEKYTEAVKLNPKNAIYYANRAAAQTHLKHYDEAKADCRMAIKVDPTYHKAHSRLAFIHFQLGEYQTAVDCYNDALKVDPTNAQALAALQLAKDKLNESARPVAAAAPPQFNMNNLSEMFSNPAVQSMAQNFAASMGQGQPGADGSAAPPFDLNALLSNPAMQQMAQSMMQGQQAAPTPASIPASSSSSTSYSTSSSSSSSSSTSSSTDAPHTHTTSTTTTTDNDGNTDVTVDIDIDYDVDVDVAAPTPAPAPAAAAAAAANPFAAMMAGAGGGGGAGGGAPDLGSMLNNPEFLQMSQSMMSSPAFQQMAESMMQDPNAMSNMMSMLGGGAGGVGAGDGGDGDGEGGDPSA